MSNDVRIDTALRVFAFEHGVELLTFDDWKNHGARIVMLKGGRAVERLIDYMAMSSWIPSLTLNGMLAELDEEPK